jgi:uncharacterized membrane protein
VDAAAGRAAAAAEAGPNRTAAMAVEVLLAMKAADLPTVAAGLAAVEDEEALRRSTLPGCLPV